MFIDGLLNADAFPVLERVSQFAARRQELLAHNIANLSTPNFRPADVSVRDFQASLSDAVDRRRAATGGVRGDLPLQSTREVAVEQGGRIALRPTTPGNNILFHDRNNRDLERLMQEMVENLTAFRVAGDLMRNRMQLMQSAIAERV